MLSFAHSPGIFQQNDLQVVQTVYDRVSVEPWFTSQPDEQENFARYVLRMYARGLIYPDRLEGLCRIAAQKRFAKPGHSSDIAGRRFLVVEDEYAIATEAARRLKELGAIVVGPVGDVSDALAMVEAADIQFDAALLDIALDGQLVYPVAAFLKMQEVPFAFVTGYDDRQVPPAYRQTPTFTKPADWGMIASSLARGLNGSTRVLAPGSSVDR